MSEEGRHYRNIAVIGAGAWGTTLARLLAEKGMQVRLWCHEREVVESVRHKRENTVFLPGITLPTSVTPTNSLPEAVQGSDLLLFVVPSHAARSVLKQLAPLLSAPVPVVSGTKGIEEETLKLMSEVLCETLPVQMHRAIAVLSGPSFAVEVCRERPTAVSLAGQDAKLVHQLQALFMTPYFRVYAGTDLIGVQLGGALKNVMALASGVVDGLDLGHNARAALITRGLAEMIRLGAAMGAEARTFYGLSGLGDLVLTCTGPLSRNYSAGVRLGKGEKLAEILGGTRAVIEGVRTSRAAAGLAERYRVDMPIARQICAVLFDGKSPRQAVSELMERAPRDEMDPNGPGTAP